MTDASQSFQPVTPETLAIGEYNRRQTLGTAYVERATATAQEDDFMKPLQEAVTGLAWGAVWGRPGLSLKHRSLVTVSVLMATGRSYELKLHINGLLNNGWTEAELQEVLLHAGCYCGMPATVDGFRQAREVLRERAAGTT